MEFDFSVNAILTDGINELDRRMIPHRNGHDRTLLRRQLFEIVDKMGEASAEAQGLHGAITSGRKMESTEHKLYIMKDQEGLRGKGSVVGLLKTGRKRLFVYDLNGKQHEMEPLCVLDFYVHESRQRTGCGKRLFEYMLQHENIRPHHLAVDRPSHKFSQFLLKHYNLRNKIPQTNNFVVYEGFLNQNDCFIDARRNGRILNSYLSYGGSAGTEQRNGVNTTGYHGNRPPSGSRLARPPSGKTSQNTSRVHPSENSPNPVNMATRPSSGRNLSARSRPPSGSLRNRPPSGKTSEEVRMIQEHNIQAIKELNLPPRPNSILKQRANSPQQSNQSDPPLYSRYTNQIIRRTPSPLQRKNSHDRIELYKNKVPQKVSPQQINLHQQYQGRGGHLRINPVTGNVETCLPKLTSADINNRLAGTKPPGSPWQPPAKTENDTISWTIGTVDPYRGQPNRRHHQFRFW